MSHLIRREDAHKKSYIGNFIEIFVVKLKQLLFTFLLTLINNALTSYVILLRNIF